MPRRILWVICLSLCTLTACRNEPSKNTNEASSTKEKRNAELEKEIAQLQINPPANLKAPPGMVWIPGGTFDQGAVPGDPHAMTHEKPNHLVGVDGFFMDMHEVTNAQFAQFVKETGYVTVAERPVVWEELKKQLPEGTEKPHDSIMQPGSLVFQMTSEAVSNLYDFSQWWKWKIGANWRNPKGPGTNLEGKENHPVVHIAFEDAQRYCEWAGRRLPTEAEWEYASRAGKKQEIHFWGNNSDKLSEMANSWNGEFPTSNSLQDGYLGTAPVGSFPSNGFGLYEMAGNVWEWTSDWYHSEYYGILAAGDITLNPKGPNEPYNSSNPYAREKVIKGGSFLCNETYCASYRNSSRMATSLDSSLEHLGFRTVASVEMIDSKSLD